MDGTPEDGGRPPISALVTTYNEERHIADCLASLDWCDEVLVVDSFSTDRTPEIVRGCERARFVQRTYYGSASQKNWAMDQTQNEWVLILDADERCTPELRAEIEALFQAGEPAQDAYTIKRRVFFLGKVIRFSGWQHDRVVRLLRRDAGRYPNRRVHADMLTRTPRFWGAPCGASCARTACSSACSTACAASCSACSRPTAPTSNGPTSGPGR